SRILKHVLSINPIVRCNRPAIKKLNQMKRTIFNSMKVAFFSGALLMAVTSCDKKTETVNEDLTVQEAHQSETVDAKPAGPTDAQIASIAVNANSIDIDYAKIAKSKSTNPEVLKFADTMAKDHQ